MKKQDGDVLNASLQRRLKHLMVQILDSCDSRLMDVPADILNLFKVDIKHGFNDAIRANDSELRDYDIHYRPARINPDNTLFLTRAFIENLDSIKFSPLAIHFVGKYADYRILNSFRSEIGVGVVYVLGNQTWYSIEGVTDCVNLIPILDKLSVKPLIQDKYQEWRQEIINQYLGGER